MMNLVTVAQMVRPTQPITPRPSAAAQWQATLNAQAKHGSTKLLAEVTGQPATRPPL